MSSTPAAPERKRALLTGGTGFVGANLARRLLRDGHEVGLLVRPSHDPWRLADVASQVRWIEASLADPDQVRSQVAAFKPHWLFHLAAHGGYSWQTHGPTILQTNLIETAN